MNHQMTGTKSYGRTGKEFGKNEKTGSFVSGKMNQKRRELLVFWLLAAVVFVTRLWYVGELYAPFVYNDEMGYWSHAANLSGLSWTCVENGWYSYGYSLILVPLFWITHNMGILYRLAIGLNAVLGVISLWAGYHIILELNEDFDRTVAMFISFVAASYSAYVFQSKIAWSEAFLYTWFMLTALQAIRFCKKPTYLNTALLTAAVVFLYVIHNRTLAIWVALLLTLIYMLFRRQISWKHMALAVGILALAWVANAGVKEYLTSLMWGASETVVEFDGNNVASQSEKVKLIFSVAGIRRLINSLAGKLWYLLSSTFLVGYLGMLYLLKGFFSHVRGRRPAAELSCETDRAGEPAGTATAENSGLDSAFLFMSLSVLGTVALATIVAVPKAVEAGDSYGRLDILFYGRYSDMISGLLILLGLAYLYQGFCRKRNVLHAIWEMVPGLLIYGISFAMVQNYFSKLSVYVINIPCVPGVLFLRRFTNYTFSFVLVTAIAAALFLLIFLGFHLFTHRLHRIGAGARCVLVGLGMTVAFLVTARNGFLSFQVPQQDYNETHFSECSELLAANSEYDIYGRNLSAHHTFRQYMRATVVEADIYYSKPSSEEDNYFLIEDAAALEALDFTSKNYYYIMTVEEEELDDVYILAVGDEIAQELESQGYTCTPAESASDVTALSEATDDAEAVEDTTEADAEVTEDAAAEAEQEYD